MTDDNTMEKVKTYLAFTNDDSTAADTSVFKRKTSLTGTIRVLPQKKKANEVRKPISNDLALENRREDAYGTKNHALNDAVHEQEMATSIQLYADKKKQFNEKLVERLAKEKYLKDLKR
jgi:hypothetical protein